MSMVRNVLTGLFAIGLVASGAPPIFAAHIDVDPGDYFSKTYYVDATGIPYHFSRKVDIAWTVKRNGRVVRRSDADGWFLRPGKYKFKYRVTAKQAPAQTAPLSDWGWSECNFDITGQTMTATTTTEIASGVTPTATSVRYFAQYFRDSLKPGTFYYYNRFVARIEFADAGDREVNVDELPMAGRNRLNSDRAGLIWVDDGIMVVQTYPDFYQTRVTDGTVTCLTSTASIYQQPFSITEQVVGFDPSPFHATSVPLETLLHLSSWKDVLASGSVAKRVRAINGTDVTSREATSIRIGMPKSRVHRIFGTTGTQNMLARGFETREYDGWVFIAYVDGRVSSIQKY